MATTPSRPRVVGDANAPLKLADGRLVYPGGRIVDPRSIQGHERPSNYTHVPHQVGLTRNGVDDSMMVEIPTNRDAQRMIAQTRRRIADLPDVPRTMNAISVVLSYTLFGLDDSEISVAIGLSEQQVGNIKMTDAYASMHSAMVTSIMEAEMNDVRDLFRQHSRTAANVLVDGLHNGNRGDRMLAAKDFLDRAGHRPVDVVEHRMRVEGGLVIEVIKRDDTQQPVTIDVQLSDRDIAEMALRDKRDDN